MYLIRPIEEPDIDAFEKLALSSIIGMTNLPKNRKLLQMRIIQSQEACAKVISKPVNEQYTFVLENIETGEIGGVSGLFSRTGVDEPTYFYQIQKIQPTSKTLNLPDEISILQPVWYHNGSSEICSLYLMKEHRKEGLGRLLSLSRFLFAAAHPERFDPIIVAEMRGVIDKNGHSPFWEGLGRHFYDIEFEAIMNLLTGGKHFIPEILPKYPIYEFLLPKEAREVIGKVHANTRPAMNMLSQEGFALTNEVDIFDAGPKIAAPIKEIRTIKDSVVGIIKEVTSIPIESDKYILSNERLDFRACYSHIQSTDNQITITAQVAKGLQVDVGDKIRYVLASPPTNGENALCQATTTTS